MARPRKTQTVSVRFGPALKTFFLCLLIGGAGVGYVRQKNEIHLLSEQKKNLELRREKLERDRQVLVRELAALQTPTALEAQLKRMKLGLEPVAPDRIIRLAVPGGLSARDERPYAEQLVRVR